MDLIKGKVAAIKGDYALVINKGLEDGVEEDMRFIVYEEGEVINDPETQMPLGNLEYVKAKVRVKYPSERLSLAETYETYAVPGTAAQAMASIFVSSVLATKYERVKLPLDATMSSLAVSGSCTPNVKIGDLVRQIIG